MSKLGVQPPEHLDLLYQAALEFNSTLDVEELLPRIFDRVIATLDAEAGSIWLRKGNSLVCGIARGPVGEQIQGLELPVGAGIVGDVARRGEAELVADAREDPRFVHHVDQATGFATRSMVAAPLTARGEVLGVLQVLNKRSGTGQFDEGDRALLIGLASTAGLALRNAQLHDAEKRVQAEKLAAIGRLAAGIVHEINSPLGVIIGNIDTICRGVGRIEQRLSALPALEEPGRQLEIRQLAEMIDASVRSSQEASARIHDIVGALKSFVGLDQAERMPIDANEALDATLTLLAQEIGTRVRVVREYGTLPPLTCWPGRLNQAFMNLLLNAVQATDGEGEVRIKSEHRADQLRITIEDTGRGMDADQLARVFDPGFTTKKGRIGAGLGLAITRQIVQEHDGEIQIESQPGVGTSVTLFLPSGTA